MIFNVTGGGGGTGGALTVTAPANVTVTVSKDGKTKTKNSGTSGTVVFTGLETGTWTITITNGSQTSTKPVVITADYSAVIAFFSATIHVTYPAGSNCTATDGTTTLTAPDTSGAWECVVPNAGTWTVSCTDGSATAGKPVSITEKGQTSIVTLRYGLVLFDGDGIYSGEWQGKAIWYAVTTSNVKVAPSVTTGDTLAATLAMSKTANHVGAVVNDFVIPPTIKRIDIKVNNVSEFTSAHSVAAWTVDKLEDKCNRLATVQVAGNAGKTVSLDLSSVTSPSYLMIGMFTEKNSTATFFDIQSIVGVYE